MTQFNREEFAPLEEIRLISDEQEYEEGYIDEYLEWLAKYNPTSPHKTEDMVRNYYDAKFFKNRRHELERECPQRLKERLLRYYEMVETLEISPCPLGVVGLAAHQVTAQSEKWREEELCKLKQRLDEDLEWIRAEYSNVMRQCEERIAQAQQQYNEAKERWKQENSYGSGNLDDAA